MSDTQTDTPSIPQSIENPSDIQSTDTTTPLTRIPSFHDDNSQHNTNSNNPISESDQLNAQLLQQSQLIELRYKSQYTTAIQSIKKQYDEISNKRKLAFIQLKDKLRQASDIVNTLNNDKQQLQLHNDSLLQHNQLLQQQIDSYNNQQIQQHSNNNNSVDETEAVPVDTSDQSQHIEQLNQQIIQLQHQLHDAQLNTSSSITTPVKSSVQPAVDCQLEYKSLENGEPITCRHDSIPSTNNLTYQWYHSFSGNQYIMIDRACNNIYTPNINDIGSAIKCIVSSNGSMICSSECGPVKAKGRMIVQTAESIKRGTYSIILQSINTDDNKLMLREILLNKDKIKIRENNKTIYKIGYNNTINVQYSSSSSNSNIITNTNPNQSFVIQFDPNTQYEFITTKQDDCDLTIFMIRIFINLALKSKKSPGYDLLALAYIARTMNETKYMKLVNNAEQSSNTLHSNHVNVIPPSPSQSSVQWPSDNNQSSSTMNTPQHIRYQSNSNNAIHANTTRLLFTNKSTSNNMNAGSGDTNKIDTTNNTASKSLLVDSDGFNIPQNRGFTTDTQHNTDKTNHDSDTDNSDTDDDVIVGDTLESTDNISTVNKPVIKLHINESAIRPRATSDAIKSSFVFGNAIQQGRSRRTSSTFDSNSNTNHSNDSIISVSNNISNNNTTQHNSNSYVSTQINETIHCKINNHTITDYAIFGEIILILNKQSDNNIPYEFSLSNTDQITQVVCNNNLCKQIDGTYQFICDIPSSTTQQQPYCVLKYKIKYDIQQYQNSILKSLPLSIQQQWSHNTTHSTITCHVQYNTQSIDSCKFLYSLQPNGCIDHVNTQYTSYTYKSDTQKLLFTIPQKQNTSIVFDIYTRDNQQLKHVPLYLSYTQSTLHSNIQFNDITHHNNSSVQYQTKTGIFEWL